MTTAKNETCSTTPALAGTEAYLLTEFTRLDGNDLDYQFLGLFESHQSATYFLANYILDNTDLLEIANPWDDDEDLIQLFKAQSSVSEDAIDWSGLKDFYLSRHSSEDIVDWFTNFFDETYYDITLLPVIAQAVPLALGALNANQ